MNTNPTPTHLRNIEKLAPYRRDVLALTQEELETEYALIQEKKCELSAIKRKYVISLIEFPGRHVKEKIFYKDNYEKNKLGETNK